MSEVSNGLIQALGNYRILEEIGSGSSGKVYQGKHIILTERTVAIKLLHSHLRSAEEYERFVEEARILERLKHPHILHIFDVGIHEGFPYLVAEYAPQGSLRNHLNEYLPNPMPLEEALTVLTQVGRGLYYAHRHNIIHRDLKPENILFNAQGQALLADFGIATTLSAESVIHATIIGTPSYMAPEQFFGTVSKESDQYALGCIAYELFTGRVPFTGTDILTMGMNHLMREPLPPKQLNPQLPLHIERAILKAMAKQRSDRYADIKTFILALYTSGDTDPQLSLPTVSGISFFTGTDNAGPPVSPTPITPLPLHEEQQVEEIPSSYATELIKTPLPSQDLATNATVPKKSRTTKRKQLLIAVVCLLVIASILPFALSNNSQPRKASVTEVVTHISTHLSTHAPTHAPTHHPAPTHTPIVIPTRIPTPTPTPTRSSCHPTPHCRPNQHCRPCH
jgi:serine/threonine protein kinase